MRPAFISASMAICLPGMASRLKRAATSAIRPEPLVMTMKFTTRRMAKRIRPMTTSPPMRKPPKAATTWPAASGPSLPWLRMRRVVATLSESRNSVVSRRSCGKLVKSRGRSRKKGNHQDKDRGGDGERETEIEQHGGERQDQQRQQAEDCECQPDIGARREVPPGCPYVGLCH